MSRKNRKEYYGKRLRGYEGKQEKEHQVRITVAMRLSREERLTCSWTYLFAKEPYKNGGKTLLKIFPSKTKGLGQRDIYNELQAVKAFRNRIAHHEAICFDAAGTKSTRANYALVIKYIQFLGYPEAHLYYGLDILPDKIMQKIDSL